MTVGTVKLVDGNTIYVTATEGAHRQGHHRRGHTIKVTKDGKAPTSRPGTTVVVQGTAGDDGDVAATTVTQGGSAGGFGGFGGFGGRPDRVRPDTARGLAPATRCSAQRGGGAG